MSRMSILLAEDEISVGLVICRQLEAFGFTASWAASGDDAYTQLETGLKPDLLITDLVMPGELQGLELAKKAKDLLPKLPVIFMTGYPNSNTSELETSVQCSKFVWKPIRMDALLSVIRELLDR